jgi:1-aminocyclopropane-1-carboxylate deaminase/D-cysteine desulfhydrase-like pyridoxal-dependent ACC family enzyme
VLRLDKIHPVISGNKWFKLKYWLERARADDVDHIVTFGGAFSNHIVATAAAGKIFGFKTTGVIRGEEPQEYSHTLNQAKEYGMELLFLSRADFREKKITPGIPKKNLLINEGGYGELGVEGAAEILDYAQKESYSHICCAIGTTTMMAGLVRSSLAKQKVLGFAVLKNTSLVEDLQKLLTGTVVQKNFSVVNEYHFGGYAKRNSDLISFMNEFYDQASIPTDFVYTGKLFFGVIDLVKKNYFPPGSHILIVHSGGLQGNDSLPKNLLRF